MAKPQIRLKGFDEEWYEQLLQDCLDISNERNTSNSFGREHVLSVSDECGIVNQIKHLGRSYAGADISNYKVVKTNQIVYTKSPLKMKPYGIIKANQFEEGIASVLYAVYDVKPNVSPDFIDLYFSPSYRINNYLRPLINKGAKNTINITDEGALKGYIYLPLNKSEQEGIAAYFRSLDELIQASAKKVDSLKQMKTACLQTMFPQPGETTPRVRFKGFTGDWETTKLSSLAKRVTRKNNNLETQLPLTISSQYGLVSQLDYFNNVVASANLSDYYLIKRGEFAYNKSYSTGYPFGSVKRLDSYDMGALSTLYIVFEVASGVSSNYLACFFDTSLWYGEVSQRAAEGARNHGLLNISAEDFLDINIMMPKSQTEQELIASYFRELDNQIRLHEQKLEKLKQIKASCLDKMFV